MSDFNLPAATWNDLKVIITSYANQKKEVSNEDIAKISGLTDTKISRNNKFLSDNELIEGGRNKKPTELCIKLGRAIMHEQTSDIKKYTRELIEKNENISELVTALRIQGNKTKDEFSTHILYYSGQGDNQFTKAGSKCIVDILLESGLIHEEDGVLKVSQSEESETHINQDIDINDVTSDAVIMDEKVNKGQPVNKSNNIPISFDNRPTIAINIQLQLPESDNPEVYENLFKSLRKNLIDG